jgi:quercetin dioxygenase-like cupin family protein
MTSSVHTTLSALALTAFALLPPLPAPAAGDAAADATVRELAVQTLAGNTDKELRLLTVDYRPGGMSLPHRHNAQVLVYVLEGRVRMQVEGAAPVILGPGSTFYEGPDDVHAVSANASSSAPARLLVFMVKNKGAPVSVPVIGGGSAAAPIKPR